MAVSAKFQYPLSAEEMHKHFTNGDFFAEMYAATGARNIEILECANGKTKTRREVPANVPGFAKKFLGEWNTVVQSEQWTGGSGRYSNDISADIEGAPITISSTATLNDNAEGCEFAVTVSANVSIPLVGKKVAAIVEDDIEAAMQREYEFGLNYVKG